MIEGHRHAPKGRGGRAAAALAVALLLATGAALAAGEEAPLPGEAGPPPAEEARPAAPADTGTIAVEGASQDVTGALQGQEGVHIQTMCTHCNSANIQVGGLSQDLVPVLWDGTPLLGGLAVSYVLQMLPGDTVTEAHVTKGPGEAWEPGPAAGGVIELTRARPDELPCWEFSGEAGSFGRRAGMVRVSGRVFDWLSGTVTLGREYADAVDSDGDTWVDVGEMERNLADALFRMTFGRDHVVNVGASWIEDDTTRGRGGFDVVGYLFGPDAGKPQWTREDTFVDRRAFRAGWEWMLPSGGTFTLRALDATRHQSVHSQYSRLDLFGPAFQRLVERYRIRERQDWGQARLRLPIGTSLRLDAGVEAIHERVTAQGIEPGTGTVLDEATDYYKTWSGWAEIGWTPSPKWDLQLGVRRDDDELFGAETLPRATIRWFPAHGWTVRVFGGKTFRPPKPIFSAVCCGQRYQRNVNVRAEVGTTWGIETTWQPSPEWKAAVYASRTDFDDHIVKLVGWSQLYIQTYALANVRDARAETLEFTLRWKPVETLTIDGSLGWLSFFDRGNGPVRVLVYPPSMGTLATVEVPMDRVPYRPVRTGSLGVSWTAAPGVSFSAQANYTGGMLIQQFERNASSFGNILLPGMRWTPGFWLVSVSGDFRLLPNVNLAAGIDNLTDRIQDDLGDPTTDYNWGPLTGRTFFLALRFHGTR